MGLVKCQARGGARGGRAAGGARAATSGDFNTDCPRRGTRPRQRLVFRARQRRLGGGARAGPCYKLPSGLHRAAWLGSEAWATGGIGVTGLTSSFAVRLILQARWRHATAILFRSSDEHAIR